MVMSETRRLRQVRCDRASAAAGQHARTRGTDQLTERRARAREFEAELTVGAEQQEFHGAALTDDEPGPICLSRNASSFWYSSATWSSV